MTLLLRGLRPCDPGIYRFRPECRRRAGAIASPRLIPAAQSALRSHPCVAVSSARVIPEWNDQLLADNRYPSNGDNPLNFVSHPRGSVQAEPPSPPHMELYLLAAM